MAILLRKAASRRHCLFVAGGGGCAWAWRGRVGVERAWSIAAGELVRMAGSGWSPSLGHARSRLTLSFMARAESAAVLFAVVSPFEMRTGRRWLVNWRWWGRIPGDAGLRRCQKACHRVVHLHRLLHRLGSNNRTRSGRWSWQPGSRGRSVRTSTLVPFPRSTLARRAMSRPHLPLDPPEPAHVTFPAINECRSHVCSIHKTPCVVYTKPCGNCTRHVYIRHGHPTQLHPKTPQNALYDALQALRAPSYDPQHGRFHLHTPHISLHP
jgi:hypothetical protein